MKSCEPDPAGGSHLSSFKALQIHGKQSYYPYILPKIDTRSMSFRQ